MDTDHPKEIGLPDGRTLRYEGDASRGLRIGLANDTILEVNPEQVSKIFSALSGFNPLLVEPSRGRALPGEALRAWSLSPSGQAVLRGPLDKDTALRVAFAFMGEGLLEMILGSHGPEPDGFPARRDMDCLTELEGLQAVYLEGRLIAHVTVAAVSLQSAAYQAGYFKLTLRRLASPGFPAGGPDTFNIGGACGEGSLASMNICNMTMSYIGSQLVTCPGQVREIVEFAARRPRFRELYRRIRAV